MYKEHYKKFKEIYLQLVKVYGEHHVFYDLMKMSAIAIYNAFAKNQEMEQEYLRTINTYEKHEQELFPKMFNELVMMYESSYEGLGDIADILGPFYEEERLGNSHIGQFFTPTHISDMMAEIIVGDKEKIEKEIEKNGFISVCEPTCRSWRYNFVIG